MTRGTPEQAGHVTRAGRPKRWYVSQQAAAAAAAHKDGYWRAYRCRYCGFWHLTRKPYRSPAQP